MALEKKEHTLYITIKNINQANALALIKMFGYMEYLGEIGSSRMCSFFADGDGSFHPEVSFVYPEKLPELPEISGILPTGDFEIDSDQIAWKIYHDD